MVNLPSDIAWEEKVNKLGENRPASTTYEDGTDRVFRNVGI